MLHTFCLICSTRASIFRWSTGASGPNSLPAHGRRVAPKPYDRNGSTSSISHRATRPGSSPTFATLGSASVPSFVDGRSFVPLLRSPSPPPSDWRTAFLEEGRASKTGHPAFKAIRTTDHLWVEYADRERELYDLEDDPYELESKDDTASEDLKRDLAGRLDELRDCSTEGCRDAEGF